VAAYPDAPPLTSAQALAPPHSLEAEQSVLGAVLLSDKVHYAYVIEEGLKPDDFYRERHQVIYQSMLTLYEESEPIDVVTVTEHLRARGALDAAGGPPEIDALTAAVPAVGNLRRYGQIVREMSLLRKLLTATYEIQSSVHNHEGLPRDIVEQAEKAMLETTARRTSARSARSSTRSSTAGTSCPPRAAPSPARPRASTTSTRSPAASSRGT
jgi:replicative DNA helicase